MKKQTHRPSADGTVKLPHDQQDQAAIGLDHWPNGGVLLFVFTQAFEKKARLSYSN